MDDKEWIERQNILHEKINELERHLAALKKINEMEVLAAKQECWKQAENDKEGLIKKLVQDKTHVLEKWDIEDMGKDSKMSGMKGKFYKLKPITDEK